MIPYPILRARKNRVAARRRLDPWKLVGAALCLASLAAWIFAATLVYLKS